MEQEPADTSAQTPRPFATGTRDWLGSLVWAAGMLAASHVHDVFAPDVSGDSWAALSWISGPFVVFMFVSLIAAMQSDKRRGKSVWARRLPLAFVLYLVLDMLPLFWR